MNYIHRVLLRNPIVYVSVARAALVAFIWTRLQVQTLSGDNFASSKILAKGRVGARLLLGGGLKFVTAGIKKGPHHEDLHIFGREESKDMTLFASKMFSTHGDNM